MTFPVLNSAAKELRVYCVRTGDKFSVDYVHRLRNMVFRNLGDYLFDFICLSDAPIDGVQCQRTDLRKWWPKVMLFEETRIPCLFFDLDTVIVGSIAPLAGAVLNAQERTLLMLRHFRKDKPGWMSGVMAWRGDWSFLSAAFNRDRHVRQFVNGDQQYLTYMLEKTGSRVDAVQSVLGGVYSYKRNLLNGKELPADATVVCFHGRPLPHEVCKYPWMVEHWR